MCIKKITQVFESITISKIHVELCVMVRYCDYIVLRKKVESENGLQTPKHHCYNGKIKVPATSVQLSPSPPWLLLTYLGGKGRGEGGSRNIPGYIISGILSKPRQNKLSL